MNRTKFTAAALATLVIGSASAEAACKPSHVANKTWMMSATDVGGGSNALIYCKFTTSAAGTVGTVPSGCLAYQGTAPNFSTPMPFDLISASITLIPGGSCGFDLEMALVNPASQTLKARLVMESGKTTATGSWVSNFGSFGTVSIMRQ